jgi:hypothetical protein
MKNLAKLLLLGTIGLGVLGCTKIKREYSEVMHEDGVVTDMNYTPGYINEWESNQTIQVGDIPVVVGTETHRVWVPAKYRVKIEAENKKFRLGGSRAEKVYNKLEENQKVDVSYQEVYRAFYKDIHNNNEKELVKRKLISYKFLDANPKEKK